MTRIARSLVALGLIVSLTGCLGTIVQAPTGKGASYGDTRVHIIGSSTEIDVRDCKSGLQEVSVWVPLWGVAVGILTLGIIVPMTTVATCAR
jgi:hypothetical protein